MEPAVRYAEKLLVAYAGQVPRVCETIDEFVETLGFGVTSRVIELVAGPVPDPHRAGDGEWERMLRFTWRTFGRLKWSKHENQVLQTILTVRDPESEAWPALVGRLSGRLWLKISELLPAYVPECDIGGPAESGPVAANTGRDAPATASHSSVGSAATTEAREAHAISANRSRGRISSEVAKRRAIVKNERDESTAEICKRLSDEGCRLPAKWTANFPVMRWPEAYKHRELRRRIDVMVSKDRHHA
jgi:hypothetical protein